MIKITTENLIAVDVDDTLTLFVDDGVGIELTVPDPYGVLKDQSLKVHWPNVHMVKRGYARGLRYFIWSKAGALWAAAVAKALDMEGYFEFSCGKPAGYIDDKECAHWMGDRSYLSLNLQGWGKLDYMGANADDQTLNRDGEAPTIPDKIDNYDYLSGKDTQEALIARLFFIANGFKTCP